VVLLRDLPIFDGALPTKLIEALAAGRPVVLSGRGESANLLERSAAGIVVPPEDPRALSQAIQSLSADPDLRAQFGRAGRRFADQHFGATRSAQEWEGRLNEAVRLREARRRNARRPVARDQGSNAPGCSSK
jgi:glycosyltransferase involved in cell wall biosynthesis